MSTKNKEKAVVIALAVGATLATIAIMFHKFPAVAERLTNIDSNG